MGKETGISWTDATWNPIRGCSRVSEGCRNCYAEGIAYRFSGPGKPYEGLVRIGSDGERRREWNGQVKFVEKHLLDPLKWHPAWMRDSSGAIMDTRPLRIFVNSMSDLFHENVTDEMRDKIFAVMALCPQHTFQVLTKRPERMLEYFNCLDREHYSKVITNPRAWFVWKEVSRIQACAKKPIPSTAFEWTEFSEVDTVKGWPLPNVHLGVSCENQATADERIPLLLQTPAAVRFISAEPLLDPFSIRRWMWPTHEWWLTKYGSYKEALDSGDDGACGVRRQALVLASARFLDWVIVGGESGPNARPCNILWIRHIIRECKAAAVPVFVKQLGADTLDRYNLRDRQGADITEFPPDLRVREFPRIKESACPA